MATPIPSAAKIGDNRRVFGDRLRDAMLVHGYTAAEFARRVGVPRQTVAKWLKMHTADLSAEHCCRASEVLGIRTYWLIRGIGKMAPRYGSPLRLTTGVVVKK
jgi:transcriptional regulator with XRE-family HTH domain